MKKTSRILISVLLALIMVISVPIGASAEVLCAHGFKGNSIFTDGKYSYVTTEGGVIIKAIDGKVSGAVTIPASVAGQAVIGLGTFLFRHNTEITSIRLPDTLTVIESNAFEGCSALKTVTIPDSVTSIQGNAFYDCSSLSSVKLPSALKTIEDSTFTGCVSLNEIDIPDSVTFVFNNAFNNTGIFNKESNWENGVLYIDDFLYAVKNTVSEKYTVKAGTRHITDRAFLNHNELTEIILPESLEIIGTYAFYDCKNLKKVTLPSSLEKINSYAFYGCSSLEAITFPSSLKEIGNSAFHGTKINRIVIPNSNTRLNGSVFGDCKELTEVTLPEGITEIPDNLFDSCVKLENISIPSSVNSVGKNAFDNTAYLTAEAKAHGGALYINNILCYADKNLQGTFKVKQGTTKIAVNAFGNCEKLSEVIIPDTVTEIEKLAFYNCTNLSNITLPESITKIGKSAFSGCKSFSKFTFPEKITEIPASVLNLCTSLEEVNIGKNVNKIDISAFTNLKSLKNINIHSENQHFSSEGNVLFNKDKTILIKSYDYVSDTYTVPLTVKEIGKEAFTISNLKSIKLHDNIEKIGADAFKFSGIDVAQNKVDGSLYIDNCLINANVTEHYAVKDGTRLIADEAFAHNYLLKELYIPESVKYIGAHILYSDINIKKITVESSDAVIHNCALINPLGANAVICGYSGSTTEEHTKLYGLHFSSLGKAPAKITETDSVKLFGDSCVIVIPGISRDELFKAINTSAKLVDKNGKTVADNLPIGGGIKIVSDDNSFEKTVIAAGDADEDGKLSAADARLALRASVNLENLSETQKAAANIDNSDKNISAADARIILRASVGLENMKEILRAM